MELLLLLQVETALGRLLLGWAGWYGTCLRLGEQGRRLVRWEEAVTKLVEGGLLAVVVLAVLAFGGTELLSWSLVQLVVLSLAFVLLVSGWGRPDDGGELPLLAPAALLLLVGVQALGAPLFPAGVSRYASQTHWLRLVTYVAAFFVGLAVLRRPGARRRVVVALIALGVFEALYGLVQYLTGWQQIFTYVKRFYREDATGTYINHNHFAGFLGMVIPLVFALALYFAEKGPGRRGRAEGQKSLLLLLVGLLLLLAVVFSRSRMGLISAVASLLVMTALRVAGRRRALTLVVLLGFLLAAVGFTFWLGVEPVVVRFAQLPGQEYPREEGGRWAVWRDTMRLIERSPLWGTGLGSFGVAYTQVQTVHLTAFVDHAHNDYLELTAELGLLGALLLFGMIFVVARKTQQAVFANPEPLDRAIALGALGSMVALLLHSLTDFNLYIPANALVFTLILALGYSTALELRLRPEGERTAPATHESPDDREEEEHSN